MATYPCHFCSGLWYSAGPLLILAAAAVSAPGREPTEPEQYMLELINRTRAHPSTEVTRLSGFSWGDDRSPASPDLNEGLPSGTISNTPKQPLAFDLNLIDAASDYSNTLLQNDTFEHQFSGTTPGSRMAAAGFSFSPVPYGWGENLALTASSVSHPVDQHRIDTHHANLFVDQNISGRDHRLNLLDEDWTQVGIGLGLSTTSGIFSCCSHAVVSTQNFAWTTDQAFLTGVAYHDLDIDDFYTPDNGEAIAGLHVTAFLTGTNTPIGSTTTYASGGYRLQLPSGMYDIKFSGSGTEEIFTLVDFTGDDNLKLDAVNPQLFVVSADFNRDGQIDPGDFALLSGHWLSPGHSTMGDANGDGFVDPADFAILSGNWLLGTGGARTSLGSLPEPTSLMLVLLTTLTLAAYGYLPNSRLLASAASRQPRHGTPERFSKDDASVPIFTAVDGNLINGDVVKHAHTLGWRSISSHLPQCFERE